MTPGATLPYPEIGYDYTVSFTIEGKAEKPGTELFRSEDAVFYLSDPVSGMMGLCPRRLPQHLPLQPPGR